MVQMVIMVGRERKRNGELLCKAVTGKRMRKVVIPKVVSMSHKRKAIVVDGYGFLHTSLLFVVKKPCTQFPNQ